LLALGITSRVRNVEISKVLENLAKNYKAEFPFLIHYEEIKKLYDKLAEQFSSNDLKTHCFRVAVSS
jgi:predicted amidohydrolase